MRVFIYKNILLYKIKAWNFSFCLMWWKTPRGFKLFRGNYYIINDFVYNDF